MRFSCLGTSQKQMVDGLTIHHLKHAWRVCYRGELLWVKLVY